MKKIKIEIKNRWTGDVLFEYKKENNTIKDTLERAVEDGANLIGADLSRADLSIANLNGANLSRADLSRANLYEADLSRADLSRADLSIANLYEADLSRADLSRANLNGADLSRADLSRANLNGADLDKKEQIRKGKIWDKKQIVFKKCKNVIVELELQKGSIVFSINNNKCRTNKAKVISIDGDETEGKTISSDYRKDFIYEVGKMVEVEDFDLMYNVECSTGIHFFFNREDAENY